MLPSEILIAGKALIKSRKRWTQETFARDTEGTPVSSQSDRAVCWCSVGALQKVCYLPSGLAMWGGLSYEAAQQNPSSPAQRATRHLFDAFGPGGIGRNNDTLTHSEVLKKWDLAIKLAKKEEAK